MNLREEIEYYLKSNDIIINDSLGYHTDEILKIFEKYLKELLK